MAFAKLKYRENSKGERVYYVEYRLQGRKNTKFTIGNVQPRKANEIGDQIRALVLQGIDPHEYVKEQAKYSKEKPRLKLSELIKAYLKSCELSNQPNTIIIKRNASRSLISHLGNINLDQITPELIEEWMTSQNVSKTSANINLRSIRSMFNWCAEREFIKDNPFNNGRIKQYKIPDSDPEDFFTEAEVGIILEEIKVSNEQLWNIILFALETGGRVSELLELNGDDIDLQNARVLFRGSTTKTGQKRYVPLRKEFVEILKEWNRQPEERVFSAWASRTGPSLAFRRVLRRLNLWETRKGTRSFHTLRHTYASHLLMSGINIYIVSKWLGHSSVTVTEKHYGHLIPDTVDIVLPWSISHTN